MHLVNHGALSRPRERWHHLAHIADWYGWAGRVLLARWQVLDAQVVRHVHGTPTAVVEVAGGKSRVGAALPVASPRKKRRLPSKDATRCCARGSRARSRACTTGTIGLEACRGRWARHGVGCTLGMLGPAGELSDMANSLVP